MQSLLSDDVTSSRKSQRKLKQQQQLKQHEYGSSAASLSVDSTAAANGTLAIAANIPQSVAVRSLRRRLWKAFKEEDICMALRAYTATRADFDEWVTKEAEEEAVRNQKLKEKREAQKRSSTFKKIGSFAKKGKSKRRLNTKDTTAADSHVDGSFPNSPQQTPSTTDSGSQEAQFPLLQLEVSPSEPFHMDDFKSPQESYYDPESQHQNSNNSTNNRRKKHHMFSRKRRLKSPRLTTSFLRSMASASATTNNNNMMSDDLFCTLSPNDQAPNHDNTDQYVDERMTTPFHEAARCGNGPLLQLMLQHNCIEPNFKNGQLRTPLHMVSGGITTEENIYKMDDNRLVSTSNVIEMIGIGSPKEVQLSVDEENDKASSGASAKKAARAMSRFFQSKFSQRGKTLVDTTKNVQDVPATSATNGAISDCQTRQERMKNIDKLKADRLDALLAILSYVHPDDGTALAGEGASINAVDASGRTALHYAAELGREDICMALLSSFGIILTVVDDSARTPCELAAEQNHHDLAAQLEARALLYTDPYGMDDELFASVLTEDFNDDGSDERSSLVAPFSWFETLDMSVISTDRKERISKALEEMKSIIEKQKDEQEMQTFMYSQKLEEDGEEEDDDKKSTSASSSDYDEKSTEDKDQDEKMNAYSDSGSSSNSSCSSVYLDDSQQQQKTQYATSEEETKPGQNENQQKANSDFLQKLGSALGLKSESNQKGPSDSAEEIQFANLDIFENLSDSHVAQYLLSHGWIVDKAMQAFSKDPIQAMKDANIQLPEKLNNNLNSNKNNHKDDGGDAIATKTNDVIDEHEEDTVYCSICFDEFEKEADGWKNLDNCSHSFCVECLGDYIGDCAQSRSTGFNISCPHHECEAYMSQNEIQQLAPSSETYDLLTKAADELFITSASDMKFCPHPGCNGVVKLHVPPFVKQAKVDTSILGLVGAVCTAVHNNSSSSHEGTTDKNTENVASESASNPRNNNSQSIERKTLSYEGVNDLSYISSRSLIQPKKAHRFCFNCCENRYHWPVTCEQLAEWKERMANELVELRKQRKLDGFDDDTEEGKHENHDEIAQQLWMKANTRPCPKCKAPIEKNEGCNHMTCTNPHCKHEFCWICRRDWKLHNSATGGFFRCNRWQEEENHDFYDSAGGASGTEPPSILLGTGNTNNANNVPTDEETMNDPEVMMRTYGTAMHEARVAWKKSKEMKRFLHHYTRWNAHDDSATLETKMSETISKRLAAVVEAAADFTGEPDFNFNGKGLSFVYAAFTELLECRSMLQHSYAFSFYRYQSLSSKHYRRMYQLVNEQKVFEQTQSELELLTEQMSDIVARSHLRATQTQIIFLTMAAAEKRNEFTNLMISVLNDVRKEKRIANDSNKSNGHRHRNKHSHSHSASQMPTAVDDIRSLVMDVGNGHHRMRRLRHRVEEEDNSDVPFHRRRTSDGDSDIVEALRATFRTSLEDLMNTNNTDAVESANTSGPAATLNAPFGTDGILNITNNLDRFNLRSHNLDSSSSEDDLDGVPPLNDWSCSACTYMNAGGDRCAMCGTFRT